MIINRKNIKYEKAILIAIITQKETESKINESLDELEFLTATAGAVCCQRFTQKINKINSKTFVGLGKLEEIKNYVIENKIDTLIFDDELTPLQLKILEKKIDKKIIDRTNLILDIFAQRAKTSYARHQVKLARYEYFLPRLTRMWTHLERQKGGIGLRGPGEAEIETDRRILRDRIRVLKEKIKIIDCQMKSQRNNRKKFIRVSLVGYTNVGKSTLINQLAKSNIFVENKLFATLDTTVRKVVIKNLPFLITDTVGFIRKLPTQLIESFKSTLDEVREADLLIHVIDVSSPNFNNQIKLVNCTLKEIECHHKPKILVFNKIDKLLSSYKEKINSFDKIKNKLFLETYKDQLTHISEFPSILISAIQKLNYEQFKNLLYKEIKKIYSKKFI